ncbi:MAG: DUF3141 domain-containing protein, partial [Sedimenticolaceae bacterium]
EFNQRAYELFARPLVQSMSNEFSAKLGRDFHPLRFQRWAISDLNPWLQWLGPAADMVRSQREAVSQEQPYRQVEAMVSELVSASLDYYRDIRDATSEAMFFQTYGNLFSLYLADSHEAKERRLAPPSDPRELPFVRDALASIAEGGYTEAVTRAAHLLGRHGEPLPLERLQLRAELLDEYKDLLPDIAGHEARRIRGEQEIICRYEPEQAVSSLPTLLRDPADRQRLITLLERLLADPRIQAAGITDGQRQMLTRIHGVLDEEPAKRLPTQPTRRARKAPGPETKSRT